MADWRDDLAQMNDGRPAWPVAFDNGVSFDTFRARLRRGWSGERSATFPVRDDRPRRQRDTWEDIAVRCGVSRRAYRSRRRAGFNSFLAADAWNYEGELPDIED